MKEEGHEVLLEVKVEANPDPTITWKKDEQEITFDDRISQLENGSIFISEASLDDSGNWTIIADNGLGKVERKQIHLSVHLSRVPIEVSYFEI